MIYFDNAATTLKKPDEVINAIVNALQTMENSGRGVHDAALDASRVIFDTRTRLAEFFHAESPKQIAFTMNSTESLNIAIKGILKAGDHVITTAMEQSTEVPEVEDCVECNPDSRKKGMVVVLSANVMGTGDEKLGKALMKAFVFALTKQDALPETIVCYNTGAYLSIEGADTLEDLKSLESEGVKF